MMEMQEQETVVQDVWLKQDGLVSQQETQEQYLLVLRLVVTE